MRTSSGNAGPVRLRRIARHAALLALTACTVSGDSLTGSGSNCSSFYFDLSGDCLFRGGGTFLMEITAPSTGVIVNHQLQLTAITRDSYQSVIAGINLTWQSNDPRKATVDKNGLVTGVGVGAVRISATSVSNHVVEGIELNVAGPVASVAVTPASANVVQGDSRPLVARTLDSQGVEGGGAIISWSSDNSSIVSVSATGVVMGVAIGGPIRITAMSEGKNASAFVTVSSTANASSMQVSAGYLHTCLLSEGRVYCWGIAGRIGDGTNIDRLVPTAVVQPGLAFVGLTAGTDNTCAWSASGQAYCWGYNFFGEVGDETRNPRHAPTPVVQPGIAFVRLVAGKNHMCGLTISGQAYCWGYGTFGALGTGTSSSWQVPTRVSQPGIAFVGLAAGENHTCGWTKDGRAYCWGFGFYNRLGDGTGTDRLIPTAVLQPGIAFVGLVAGDKHTCGWTAAGQAYCWGANTWGQIGDGTSFTERSTPTAVLQAQPFAGLTAGGEYTCGWTTAGQAYCWGSNSSGALGDGTKTDRTIPSPVLQAGISFVGLAASSDDASMDHTCGWTISGQVYCWGSNGSGQLGDGTMTNRSTPVPVRMP